MRHSLYRKLHFLDHAIDHSHLLLFDRVLHPSSTQQYDYYHDRRIMNNPHTPGALESYCKPLSHSFSPATVIPFRSHSAASTGIFDIDTNAIREKKNIFSSSIHQTFNREILFIGNRIQRLSCCQ